MKLLNNELNQTNNYYQLTCGLEMIIKKMEEQMYKKVRAEVLKKAKGKKK